MQQIGQEQAKSRECNQDNRSDDQSRKKRQCASEDCLQWNIPLDSTYNINTDSNGR